jgi:myo-inositol-1(or 4)-monophosphatase
LKPSAETEFVIRAAKAAGKILLEGCGTRLKVEHKRREVGEIELVTEFDRRAEDLILGRIRRAFPGCRILSEESGLSGTGGGKPLESGEPIWLVDPLDGTTNFAHGLPIFSVSIALRENGRTRLGVVYDPARKEVFWAERGKGAYCGTERMRASGTADLGRSLLVTGFPYDAWTNPENNVDQFAAFTVRCQGVRRLGSAAIDLAYVAAGRFDGFWELRLAPWDVAAGGLIAEEAGARVTAIDGAGDYLTERPSILAANPALHAKMADVLRIHEEH